MLKEEEREGGGEEREGRRGEEAVCAHLFLILIVSWTLRRVGRRGRGEGRTLMAVAHPIPGVLYDSLCSVWGGGGEEEEEEEEEE